MIARTYRSMSSSRSSPDPSTKPACTSRPRWSVGVVDRRSQRLGMEPRQQIAGLRRRSDDCGGLVQRVRGEPRRAIAHGASEFVELGLGPRAACRGRSSPGRRRRRRSRHSARRARCRRRRSPADRRSAASGRSTSGSAPRSAAAAGGHPRASPAAAVRASSRPGATRCRRRRAVPGRPSRRAPGRWTRRRGAGRRGPTT